jgi:hypothetical protein
MTAFASADIDASPTLFNIFTPDFPTLTDVQLAFVADDSVHMPKQM